MRLEKPNDPGSTLTQHRVIALMLNHWFGLSNPLNHVYRLRFTLAANLGHKPQPCIRRTVIDQAVEDVLKVI
ncbi:MAG: hypothetical protein L7T26_06820 [Pseudomonadales bacterium]|nr:hypothetical protein [Pseudomonadales bacterium]